MSNFHIGQSTFKCRYLFSKDLIDLAKSKGLKLHKQVSDGEFTEAFVDFICENIVYDWDNVYDLDDNELEFDSTFLYQIFENHPKVFIELLKHCSKPDNFDMAAA